MPAELHRRLTTLDEEVDPIDWDVVEGNWGWEFPSDYKEFMDAYGEGSISEFLMILGPCAQLADDENRMREESLNAQATWSSTVESERPPGVDADSLVAWGVDGNADILCWSRRGDGPHEWPVVVYRRQKGPAWRVYDIGMADFLVALFDGAFSENPMSGAELWEERNHRFLSSKKEKMAFAAGIDPWTGEADPDAGMFG
ncbi:SMI1/KNR4 family protein [Streptomyces carpaticus]|uniref:SMI1/KNR4 family protein n=1 Tax=Streptomyces carpaticus TaxID=285558 RepID=UPI00220761CB|nr:SMI1/KNR4 family protein [Streptomyces carpaticus]